MRVLVAVVAHAQVEKVITGKRERHSIAALVMHAACSRSSMASRSFRGTPGSLKLQEEEGKPQYDLRGNFLLRSRRHWLDDETLVAVLDAPSDEWATFSQDFRATARYGSDVAAVLKQIPYEVQEWIFVGTSEGSISAFHAARMNPRIARRVILTSSLFAFTSNGRGLSRRSMPSERAVRS